MTKIFLPALLPSLLTGVRVAAPLAIMVSLLTETPPIIHDQRRPCFGKSEMKHLPSSLARGSSRSARVPS